MIEVVLDFQCKKLNLKNVFIKIKLNNNISKNKNIKIVLNNLQNRIWSNRLNRAI